MGRWSQRRRSGGGAAAPPTAISILSAVRTTSTTIVVTFSGDVHAADFAGTDWISQSSTEEAAIIGQAAPNALELEMTGDVSGDAQLDYAGTAPNVTSPQHTAY